MLLLAAIALLSAAALGYEILLLRLFSIAQWHHLAYMVISLALLGYGASGALLTLARRRLVAVFRPAFATAAALFAVTSVASSALAQRLPFNLLELVWDPRQLLTLTAGYLILSVPFLCAGTAIGLALATFQQRVGSLYRADLLGAGAGAMGIVAALFALEPEDCLRLAGGLGLLAAALVCLGPPRRRAFTAAVGLALAALLLPAAWPAGWLAPRPSEFKALSQALRVPGSRVLTERSSPLGRLTVVASPEIPLRHAPGLSLAFTDELPEQLGVFTDGDGPAVIDRWSGEPGDLPAYLGFLPSALPYHLLDRPRVLVLGAGGGTEVLVALAHGARQVDAVEMNHQLAELMRGPLDAFAGGLYRRPEVRLRVAEARSFAARTVGRWDLIQLSLVDSFGAAAASVAAPAESYLYTVEAFRLLLERLEPGGLLAVTRWLRPPPRDSLKLFVTAAAALESQGVARPGERLALIRGWSTATLLVKRGELGPEDAQALRRFCEERSFDLAYYPGMVAGEANRFNVLEEPYLYRGAVALLGPRRRAFLASYPFHVAPATDDRPYFHRFFRWRSLPELLRQRDRGGTPFLESSYLALVAVLLQAAAAAVLLILLPLAVLRRRKGHLRGGGRAGLYFFSLGLAFLFLEIAFLQRLTLFLGHPVYAAALVLGAFLVFAGLGSGASAALGDPLRRAGRRLARRGLSPTLAAAGAVAAVALLELALLPPVTHALLGAPVALRALLALAAIAPLAFLMGMPFPLGLARAAARDPDWLPWAWGVNGCASVLSPVAATLLALHLGFTAVVALAAALYLLAGWAMEGV